MTTAVNHFSQSLFLIRESSLFLYDKEGNEDVETQSLKFEQAPLLAV